jgi:hypothetical protein
MDEASTTRVFAKPALWWRGAIVLACVYGVTAQEWRLAHFTTLSVLAVMAYYSIVLYWMVRRGTTEPVAPHLRGGITLWIVTTAIVSHFIVEHGASPFPGMVDPDPAVAVEYQSRFFMHYVIPAMVLVDWIVFGPHGIVRWRDALWWLLFPLAYGVISILRGQWFPDVSDRFPYPFFDPTISGWGGVVIGMAEVLLANAVIAVGVIGLDRLSAMVSKRRNARRGQVQVESGDQHRSGITGELPEEQGASPQ